MKKRGEKGPPHQPGPPPPVEDRREILKKVPKLRKIKKGPRGGR
jgi:hypothetical protein